MYWPGAGVFWLFALLHQLTSSRQPGCVTSFSSAETLTAVVRNSCLLLSKLTPLLTLASLLGVLTDNGRRTTMGLRRISVLSPCVSQLVGALLQPVATLGSSWWLGPLASGVLALSNKDAVSVTVVQASISYILSVASVAVEFTGKVAAAADSAVGAVEATTIRLVLAGPLAQLLSRVLSLAALHVFIAIAAVWFTGDQCSDELEGKTSYQQRESAQEQPYRGLKAQMHGSPCPDALSVLRQQHHFLASEDRFSAAAVMGDCLISTFASSLFLPESGQEAEGHDGRLHGASLAAQEDALGRLTGPRPQQQQQQKEQAGKEALQQQKQVEEALRKEMCSGWHGDFRTEQRHVAATRLADVALLVYDFLEAASCHCVALGMVPRARLPRSDRSDSGATGSAVTAAMGLLGTTPAAEARDGFLERMRCLGGLLVTSWGTTVLAMNVIIILWPRSRRPRFGWIVNSACSWLAALARAALLVLLAPHSPDASAAAAGAAFASGHQRDDVVPSVLAVGGEDSLLNGQAALTALIMLMSHLIASNLSPRWFGIQSSAAAISSALLHSHLVPTVPTLVLVFMYGSAWLMAAVLSYYLARSKHQAGPWGAMAPALPLLSFQQLWKHGGYCVTTGNNVASNRQVAAVVDTERALTSSDRRALRPPRLGLGHGTISLNPSSSHAASLASIAPSTAAVSDFALRTLSRSGSPRLSAQGQSSLYVPRSHSGVSSCSAWPQEGHPPNQPHSRAASFSPHVLSPSVSTGPSGPAAAPQTLATGSGSRPASGGSAMQPQVTKRWSLESLPRRFLQPSGASLQERTNPGITAAAAAAAAVQPSKPATATVAAWPTPWLRGLSPAGTSQQSEANVLTSPATVVAGESAATEAVVSYVRRASSERPQTGGPTAAAMNAPVSRLQHAYSCGPSQAPGSLPARLSFPEKVPRDIPAVGAVAKPGAATGPLSHAAMRAAISARITTVNPPPATVVTTAAASATPAMAPSSADGVESNKTAPALIGSQGLGVMMPRTLAPLGSMSGTTPGLGNDHSMISSMILEADAYDRLLSSASSPFLLNPNAAMRYPSAANTSTLPLPGALASPNALDPRAYARLQQQQQQQQQLALQQQRQQQRQQAPLRRYSSGFSEVWSTQCTIPPLPAVASSGGGGGTSRGLATHSQTHESDLDDGDNGDGDLRCLDTSGTGVGGLSGSSRGRAAQGSWSRLDRAAPGAAAEEMPAAPRSRHIIVLADGRQVYQSETLAAATSGSTPSNSTPLSSERPRATGRDLLPPVTRSESEAVAAAAAACGAELCPESTIVLSRHLSNNNRGGRGSAAAAAAVAVGFAVQPSLKEALSRLTDSRSPYSPQPGSVAQQDGKLGGGEPTGPQWSAVAAVRSPQSATQSQSHSQVQVQRTMSFATQSSVADGPYTYSSNGYYTAANAATTASTGRSGQPFLFGSSTSGKWPRATRGLTGGGGGGGIGGTSASSQFSSGYGAPSVTGSSGGACVVVGTSGPTSYGTFGTGSSLSGMGMAGPAAVVGGGSGSDNRMVSSAPYPHRGSLDLGRHLHDTGLIRIGEEEAGLENEDTDRLTSTLFGTCDDGDVVGVGAGVGADKFISSGGGYSFSCGSETDRRSPATERPSNGTSGETAQSRRDVLPAAASSYGSSSVGSGMAGVGAYHSSSVGSGATGDVTGSVPLVVAAGAVPADSQGRFRRGRPRAGWGSLSRQQLHSIVRADMSALATGAGGGASASGSSWSVSGPRSYIEGPHGAFGSAGSGGRTGCEVNGMSGGTLRTENYRELSDLPMLQALVHSNKTFPSSSDLLPQLTSTAAAGGGGGGGSGGSGGAGSGGGSGGGGTYVTAGVVVAATSLASNGRNLGSGGSHRSSSNPSLVSFADVTLCHNLTPLTSAAPPIQTTSSYSHVHSASTAAVASSCAVMVTLARGILANSNPSSGGMGADAEDPPTAALAVVRPAPAVRPMGGGGAIVSAVASGASGTTSEGKSGSSLRFMAYPQTLAPMVGSGSMGRGSQSALKVVGTGPLFGAGAPQRGSNGTAAGASSGGRLGFSTCGDVAAGSRPTLPELLASTAAAAAAIGTTSGYGVTGGAASLWASPTSSTPLREVVSSAPTQLSAAAAPAVTVATTSPTGQSATGSSFAVVKQTSLKSYRMHLSVFAPEDGSGSVTRGGREGSFSTAGGSAPSGSTGTAATGVPAAAAAATHSSQPLSQRLSQLLEPGRRWGATWFGNILSVRRTSVMDGGTGGPASSGFGLAAGGGDAAAGPPPSSPLPRRHVHHPQSHGGVDIGGNGCESQAFDVRTSAASGAAATGRSSQQLMRLMDDTARLSPVRGVLRGLRKRIRSGVKSLSGAASPRQ